MTVSMNTVAISNIEVKVWTQKSELPQGSFLRSLIQPKITRQIHVELTDIDYDLIKDEILRMECVYYNNASGINIINVNDIEDFQNL